MRTVSSKDLDKISSLDFKTYSKYLHHGVWRHSNSVVSRIYGIQYDKKREPACRDIRKVLNLLVRGARNALL